MAIFYLIRHGEPNYDAVSKIGFYGFGRSFAPLSDRGIIQAEATAEDSRLLDAGQHYILMNLAKSDIDVGGDNIYKELAILLSSYEHKNVMTLGGIFGTGLSETNIEFMNNELINGRWVIGNLFYTDGSMGHSVVIMSYNIGTNIYTFWDPWTDSNGTFSSYQLENDTIRTVNGTKDRRLSWIQYCN